MTSGTPIVSATSEGVVVESDDRRRAERDARIVDRLADLLVAGWKRKHEDRGREAA